MILKETKIDTELFLQIISAEEGIDLDYVDHITGKAFHYYSGKNGKTVSICAWDEFITNRTAKAYMRQLGIDDLIISLFPTDETEV